MNSSTFQPSRLQAAALPKDVASGWRDGGRGALKVLSQSQPKRIDLVGLNPEPPPPPPAQRVVVQWLVTKMLFPSANSNQTSSLHFLGVTLGKWSASSFYVVCEFLEPLAQFTPQPPPGKETPLLEVQANALIC